MAKTKQQAILRPCQAGCAGSCSVFTGQMRGICIRNCVRTCLNAAAPRRK